MSQQKYNRVIIKGKIICDSDLHIGSGEIAEREILNRQYELETQSYNQIQLDSNNRPFIPSSSLRGFLSSLFPEGKGSLNYREIFGCGRKKYDKENQDQTGNAGRIRIYDAFISENKENFNKFYTQVSISPITRTAKNGHLYTLRRVEKGSSFDCEIEIENTNDEEINLILDSLQAMQHQSLGHAKSTGLGNVSWKKTDISKITNQFFCDWLLDKTQRPLSSFCKPYAYTNPEVTPKNNTYQFEINPQSPVLINDPENVTNINGSESLVLYKDSNGNAAIPGSSLKGALRSHTRKILMSMFARKCDYKLSISELNNIVDEMIAQIFGSNLNAGILQFSDALSQQKNETHGQQFNAIDRFTAKVSAGMLYSTLSSVANIFSFTISIKNLDQTNNQWIKGLLLLALRDGMEEDISLGWGRSRGYGQSKIHMIDKSNSKIVNFSSFGAAKYVQQLEELLTAKLASTETERNN